MTNASLVLVLPLVLNPGTKIFLPFSAGVAEHLMTVIASLPPQMRLGACG
jgi:hypothetical protein